MSNKLSRSYLWSQFNKEVKKNTDHADISYAENIQYDNTICTVCNIHMAWSEEGFMTCPNPACGIMCTNVIDSSPEW